MFTNVTDILRGQPGGSSAMSRSKVKVIARWQLFATANINNSDCSADTANGADSADGGDSANSNDLLNWFLKNASIYCSEHK